jgi:hypothetical protein
LAMARQPSRAAIPLLHSLQGSAVILAHRRWEPTYIASYTLYSGLLGRLLQKVLQLLMWGRSQEPLELVREASYPPPSHPGTTASSSPYSSGITVALSFHSCNPSNWPVWRRSLHCLFIPDWTSRRQTTATATAPLWSLAGLIHAPVWGLPRQDQEQDL